MPKDATHEIAGLYYKYGLRGWVFYWSLNNQEWKRSTKETLYSFNSLEYQNDKLYCPN